MHPCHEGNRPERERPPLGYCENSGQGVAPFTAETLPEGAVSRYVDEHRSRWARLATMRKILSSSGLRPAVCCRWRYRHTLEVSLGLLEGGEMQVQVKGLVLCGSVWACPVCAPRKTLRRKAQLLHAMEKWRANGGTSLLITRTLRHHRGESLQSLLSGLRTARATWKGQRAVKQLGRALDCAHRVRCLEITVGPNGWHPHEHELWLLTRRLQASELSEAEALLSYEWCHAVAEAGLQTPSAERGLDLRTADAAEAYVTKWGVEDELTNHTAKDGRKGNTSVWGLLDRAAAGDRGAAALFREYVTATKGTQQLVWSRGAKDVLLADYEESSRPLISRKRTVLGAIYDIWQYEHGVAGAFERLLAYASSTAYDSRGPP